METRLPKMLLRAPVITMLTMLVFLSCKKTVVHKDTQREIFGRFEKDEVTIWAKWYSASVSNAPKLLFDKAQERAIGNRYYMRVPLENSTGMVYFTKTSSLQAVFIRTTIKDGKVSDEQNQNIEFINLNNFSYDVVTYKNRKPDLIYHAAINTPVTNAHSSSTQVKANSTFLFDLGCILSFGIPRWNADHERECWGLNIINWIANLFSSGGGGGSQTPVSYLTIADGWEEGGGASDAGDGGTGNGGSGGNNGPYIPVFSNDPLVLADEWAALAAVYSNVSITSYSSVALSIAVHIPLTNNQKTWLTTNSVFAQDMLNALNEEETITPEFVQAMGAIIEFKRNGIGADDFLNPLFIAIVCEKFNIPPAYLEINNNLQRLSSWAVMNVAMAKIEHPTWTGEQCAIVAFKDLLQFGLDILGLVPIVGEVADIVNGIIYSIDGDGSMAALSYAAAIPVWGWTATGLKFAKRTILTAGGTTALKWIQKTNGKIMFASRGQLRRVLGLVGSQQAHHIIPWEFVEHDIVQAAAKAPGTSAFNMNELINGIGLPKNIHVEGVVHAAYNTKVEAALDAIAVRYINNGTTLTPALARTELEVLIGKIKTWIEQNPNINLNNIIIP